MPSYIYPVSCIQGTCVANASRKDCRDITSLIFSLHRRAGWSINMCNNACVNSELCQTTRVLLTRDAEILALPPLRHHQSRGNDSPPCELFLQQGQAWVSIKSWQLSPAIAAQDP
eukprot:4517357-Amphidinium_carterae.2